MTRRSLTDQSLVGVVTALIFLAPTLAGDAASTPPLGMDPAPSAVCQLTHDWRPDSSCTPGHVLTTDKTLICRTGYSATVRNVPQRVKDLVLARYGMAEPAFTGDIDHRLALSLGGSNDPLNLAPIPDSGAYGNQAKNAVEREVRATICAGKITVADGQRRFLVTDPPWHAADDDLPPQGRTAP